MLNEVNNGVYVDSGFKSASWNKILMDFNFESGLALELQQLQNLYSSLKKKWGVFKALKNCSGFGWDTNLKTPLLLLL